MRPANAERAHCRDFLAHQVGDEQDHDKDMHQQVIDSDSGRHSSSGGTFPFEAMVGRDGERFGGESRRKKDQGPGTQG